MPIHATPGFVPERLDAAVKARGLTQTALAEVADIGASTLSEYRNGKIVPSPEQLEKLAGALGFPVAFFVKPVSDGFRLGGPRLFRASASLTNRVAHQAETCLWFMSEAIEVAEKWLKLPSPDFLAEYGAIDEPMTLEDRDIEAIALSVREKLGFGRGPVTKLIRTLEKAGIPVLRYETLGKRNIHLDGLSQHTKKGRPLCAIFARETPCLSKEYFSLAHELGHIVLHSQISDTRLDSPVDEKRIEGQANRFAAAFLLPSEEFLADLYAPTLSAFEFMKRKWLTSMATMARRCFDLGVIDRSRYTSLYVQMSRKGWRKQEPLDDVHEVEQPILLKKVFELLVGREGVSKERLQSEMPLSPRDLSLISGLPVRFFEVSRPDPKILEFPSVS